MRNATYDARADTIYDMRTYIRSKYPDVRARGDIVRSLWEFVDGLEEDGPEHVREQQLLMRSGVSTVAANGSWRQAGKRKSRYGDDDNDDDYDDDDDGEYGVSRGAKGRAKASSSAAGRQTQKATRGRKMMR